MNCLAWTNDGNMRGFTVPELLVVISIMSILFGFGIFEYRTLRDRYTMEKQTKELYIDLMNARVSAMQKNRAHFVLLEESPDSTRCRIFEDDNPMPDGDGVRDALDRVVVDKTVTAPYTFTSNDPSEIQINARGLVRKADEQSIYAVNRFGSEYDCIVINVTRINMGVWNASGNTCRDR